MTSLDKLFDELKSAQARLALATREAKDAALQAVMTAVDAERAAILAANERDLVKARAGGMKESLLDRLALNDKRVDEMIDGIGIVLKQADPIGRILDGWKLPNGLTVEKVAVPLGVVAIIYESRPNVTIDAFCLAYKAACSILLRGSSAALESNRVLVAAIKKGLKAGGGESGAVALADSGDRAEVDYILNARGKIDVLIPRGGRELIRRVADTARVPVIETGEGNCHIYVDSSADTTNAVDIVENAKIQKPGACNAVETVLVHNDIASAFIPRLAERLSGRVELRLCPRSRAIINAASGGAGLAWSSCLVSRDADETDWATEYLDYILAIKVVSNVDEAIDHINRYGTKHSESILTNDLKAATAFQARVDAAAVYTNASIRFSDGAQFGFGAELGISTQKFHARGPMGLEALTTIKYRVRGNGQIRN